MRKGRMMGKIFGIALVLMMIGVMFGALLSLFYGRNIGFPQAIF